MTTKAIQGQLARMREDYAATTGKPFRHFFCPLLFRDEEVELCMGHIIPAAYRNCRRTGVVQRKDVDNFYGKVAEADFGTLLEVREKGLKEGFFDPELLKKMKPQIIVDGESVPFYVAGKHKNPRHTGMILENEQGNDAVKLVLAKNPKDVFALQERSWDVVVERDSRISALITLIKSAYLTLFRIHGYRWALSAAGLSVGYDLLGRFFLENGGKDLGEARAAAQRFFVPYKHMVRPIVDQGSAPPTRGTIEDNRAGVCFGSSGRPYALIVCVRVGEDLHAVLMPAFAHPDSVEAYHSFLTNERETIRVSSAWFNNEKSEWVVNPESLEAHWPKHDESFEFS